MPTAKNQFYCQSRLDTKDPECYSNSEELKVVERVILKAILSEIALLSDVNNLLKKYVSNKKEQISIEKKKIGGYHDTIEEKNVSKKAIFENYHIGELSKEEFLAMKAKLNDEIQAIKKKMEAAEGKIEDLQIPKDISGCDAYINFANATTLNKDLVDEFIDCVYLYDGMRMEVKWKFSDEIEKNMRTLTKKNMTIT